MGPGALFIAVFLACAVEATEAATIVLAMGTTRDWRSALLGVLAGIGVLAIIVAALGPALTLIPLRPLRLLVGGLLLIFGLQWLRKAILRASGFKALHDEEAIYAARGGRGPAAPPTSESGRASPDWYAFTLSFKGDPPRGTRGRVHRADVRHQPAQHPARGARRAWPPCVVVTPAPRSRSGHRWPGCPENTLKFIVGIMLTAFGTFWGVEGAGADWPGGDAALPVLVVAIAGFAVRRWCCCCVGSNAVVRRPPRPADPSGQPMSARLKAFGAFWYDFVVGDDWRVAVGVAVALGADLVVGERPSSDDTWWIVPLAVVILLPYSLWRATRRPRPT